MIWAWSVDASQNAFSFELGVEK
ncbi:unnamed protein product [Ectocarpus sp. CCAP 1310/34]|nr:unnamed protein product [Ectocarpus sp. CCAP 1310/34]